MEFAKVIEIENPALEKKIRNLNYVQPFIIDLKISDAKIRTSLAKCQNQKKPRENRPSNFHTVKHNQKIVCHKCLMSATIQSVCGELIFISELR